MKTNRHLLLFFLVGSLASVLWPLDSRAQGTRMTDLPAITGAAVDPAVDLLWLNDTSAGAAGSKKITLAELVNVSSFTNGNFLATDSVEFGQVNGLDEALALKAPLISPSFVTPALGTPASGNFSSGTFTWPTFNQNTTGSSATVTSIGDLTGVVTSTNRATAVADNALSIAKTNGLQTALDGKLANSMATNKLLGRGTAGTGSIEELTLGTNLSLSGTTLNATGGSGGLGRNAELKRQHGSYPTGNFWKIAGLADSAQGQAGNIRILQIGNSYNTAPKAQLGAVFGRPHGNNGASHGVQEIPISGGGSTTLAGGATQGPGGAEGQTFVPQFDAYWVLPAGGSMTVAMHGTHAWVAYVKESGAGTITIDQNLQAGAGWTNLTTIDCNGSTAFENYLSTPGTRLYREIRITASGGPVKIAYAAVLGQTSNIIVNTGGGTGPDQWNTTKLQSGTIESWWASYDPQLVFICYASDMALHADWATMMSRIQAACPNAQIIIAGEHAADTQLSPPSIGVESWDRWGDTGLIPSRNSATQAWCVDRPRVAWVDTGKWLPSLNDTDGNGIPDAVDVGSISPYDYLHLNGEGEVTVGTGNSTVEYKAVYSNSRIGTDIRVRAINPGTPSAALSVTASGNDVTISLATDGSSVATSTGSQVISAVTSAVPTIVSAVPGQVSIGGVVSNGSSLYAAHGYVRLLGVGDRSKNIALWEAMRPWIFSRAPVSRIQPSVREIFDTAGREYTQVLEVDSVVTSNTTLGYGTSAATPFLFTNISKFGSSSIEGYLIIESTSAIGFKAFVNAWNVTAAPSLSFIAHRGTTMTAGNIAESTGGSQIPIGTWDAAVSTVYVHIKGSYICNGTQNGAFDGAWGLDCAQASSSATPMKIKRGSWMKLTLGNNGSAAASHRDKLPGF